MGPIFPVPFRSLTSWQMCKEAHVKGPYINDEELEFPVVHRFFFFEIMFHYAALTVLNSLSQPEAVLEHTEICLHPALNHTQLGFLFIQLCSLFSHTNLPLFLLFCDSLLTQVSQIPYAVKDDLELLIPLLPVQRWNFGLLPPHPPHLIVTMTIW